MATFDLYAYARKHGTGKTKVKSQQGTLTLAGLPATMDRKGLLTLAKDGGVRISFPSEVIEGQETILRASIDAGKKAEGAVEGVFATEVPKLSAAS